MKRAKIASLLITLMLSSALFVVCTLPLLAEEDPSKYVVLVVDNSRSMDVADPNLQRIRFARFLVTYAQYFYPEVYVGAITFAGQGELPRISVPLTPVQTWSRADFGELNETRSGNTGTAFVRSLNTAQTLFSKPCLENQICEPAVCNENDCHIVLFTDGEFGGSGETSSNIIPVLQQLADRNIEVTTVLFDYEGKREANEALWNEIRANVLPLDPATATTEVTYKTILQPLGLDAVLDQLDVLPVNNENNLSIEFPPFLKHATLLLFADGEISETWDTQPDIVNNYWRWWFDPVPEVVNASLQATGSVTETVIYYRVDTSRVYSLSLETQVNPNSQAVGEPVTISAYFQLENGARVINTDVLRVSLLFTPIIDEACDLVADNDSGVFSCTLTDLPAGEYDIAFFGTVPAVTESSVEKIVTSTQKLIVGHTPLLDLEIALPSASVVSQTVPVTLTIANFQTIQNIYTPTLQLVESGEFLSLTPQDMGVFQGSVSMSSGDAISLRAVLPGGITQEQIPFETQVKEKELGYTFQMYSWWMRVPGDESIYEKSVEKIPDWIWFVLPLALVGGFVMPVVYFKRQQKIQESERVEIKISNEEDIKREIERLRGHEHMWPEISSFGKHFAETYGGELQAQIEEKKKHDTKPDTTPVP